MNYKPLLIGVATVVGVAHLGVLGHLVLLLREGLKSRDAVHKFTYRTVLVVQSKR